MTEQNDKNLRRMGRREQKDKLQSPDSLFPKEDASELDLNSLALPDRDAEALELLSGLKGEFKAPYITPPEERYPPLRPVAEKSVRPKSEAKTVVVPKAAPKNGFYNLMTLLILLSMGGFIAWFVQVWLDPQSSLNPLPPATPFIEVTATPNGIIAPLATPDDSGQIFVVITETPALIAPTDSPYPFIVQEILYAPNSNDLGCNWWSIAGTVRDIAGTALNGYKVRVTGAGLNESVFSGASQGFGAGGFELPLVGTPSEAEFTVQLFSAQDAPLSDIISLSTRADCDANVTIVNFVQNR